jgi:hypothetical protein
MNDEPPKAPASESGDRGVFGNLPSQRPGVRSPRRERDRKSTSSKAASGRSAKQSPGAAAEPASKPKPAPPRPEGQEPPTRRGPQAPPPPRPSAPPPHAGEVEDSDHGVEHLAWAGITVAAEAATLGVRLLSRAVEAVRERR